MMVQVEALLQLVPELVAGRVNLTHEGILPRNGRCVARTRDLLGVNQALSQLS